MAFLFSEVLLYLYKSTDWPCMKFFCHVWDDAPSCHLNMMDKTRNWVCMNHLAYHYNIVRNFSIGITLIGIHVNLLSWFQCLVLMTVPLFVLIGCMSFLSAFLGCYKDVKINIFFPYIGRSWNFLSA